jgi:hypothetical protein
MTLYQAGASPQSTKDRSGAHWSTTPYGRWRLAAESEAMKRFPGFSLRLPEGAALTWAGILRSSFNRRKRYLVTVTYPNRFPHEAPVVTIEKPALDENAPHLLGGKRPCLYRAVYGPRNGYDPARTTAATLVAWTALWIHAYETWKATGSWPGSEE